MFIDYKKFSKYFNDSFWRAFKQKVLFYWQDDLTKEQKDNIVKDLYDDIIKKNYYPSIPRDIIYKEKSKWVPRVIPVFEIKDYCLYYFCIKQLEDRIAENRIPNTFWWWSLWWKIRLSEEFEIAEQEQQIQIFEDEMANYYDVSVSEYSFNPRAWSKAYWDFNSKLKATIETSWYNFCVEFDIANFYDCINLNLLEIYIREIWNNNDSDIISILFYFLQYWNRKNNEYNKTTVWLPQDALWDCSRILANFYLQKYDKYIFEECWSEFKYFRYADDQFIFWNDEWDLKEKIFKVWIFLNKLWLSINPKKVKYWQVKKLYDYRSFDLFDLVSEDNISEDNIKKFIKETIKLYKTGNKDDLKDKWLSLLNKSINLPLTNISLWEKNYLKWLLLDENYLIQAKPYQLSKIYNLLNQNEKSEFIIDLHALWKKYKYNQYHYSVLQFLENNKLDKLEILQIITNLKDLYN